MTMIFEDHSYASITSLITMDQENNLKIDSQSVRRQGKNEDEEGSHASCSPSSSSLSADNLLPEDFVPSPYSVIIGRGKKSKEALGNIRLNVIALNYISRYSKAANNKEAKSKIVSEMYNTVLSANKPNERTAFVRQEKNGRWYVVEEGIAREKIGQVLRNNLQDNYRSSSKSKSEIRRQQRRRRRNSNMVGAGTSSRSSFSSHDSGSSIESTSFHGNVDGSLFPLSNHEITTAALTGVARFPSPAGNHNFNAVQNHCEKNDSGDDMMEDINFDTLFS